MFDEYILPEDGQWVGPPVLYLSLIQGEKEKLLDGRKRLEEHRKRGLKTSIPKLIVHSHLEALRMLIINSHHARAAEYAFVYAPQYTQRVTNSLTKVMGMSSKQLKPYLAALRDPAERHKLPRRTMGVVMRGRKLYQDMLLGKHVTPEDIAEVLGPFIED